MTIRNFMQLIEWKTKVASMLPFIMGSLYAVLRFQEFIPKNFILMLVSLLSFDMATTVINNYIDYKKAIKTHGYGYEIHNPIVHYKIKEGTVIAMIVCLLITAVLAGFLLFLQTDVLLLLIGGLSFLVGILYSFGPVAISRMPLGEIFSGLFMGFVIIFLSTYIHVDRLFLIQLFYENGILQVQMNVLEVVLLFLISIPAIMSIANIMLANNICDLEEDLENKRYTLPVYIGKKNALILFRLGYCVAYVDLIVLYWLNVPVLVLLLIAITYILVHKNVKQFLTKQMKGETFILAVKNFMLMNTVRIVALAITVILSNISFFF